MTGRLRVREQHIAVFGGSGSGKTVLVSSFYGAAQEQAFLKDSLYHVTADDTGQGNRLLQNYLGMKNAATAPAATRFSATPYTFTIKPKGHSAATKRQPLDALRLVWHDYPGEWFEEEPSSDEERQRRIDTFRALLRSEVAVVLVDGQKLIDYAGEEDKYLKSLIWGIRDGLLRLKDDLLDDGKPLERFPRIWLVALSKTDLHPGITVHRFRDLVIEKSADDLASLQTVIQGMVQLPQALSVGDDFMLLSSARFEPGRIDVEDRVGVNLLLPVALVLPLRRLVDWFGRFDIPRKWVDVLAENAGTIAVAIGSAKVVKGALAKVPKVGPALAGFAIPALTAALELGGSELKKANQSAQVKQDYLTATLTQFQLDLDQGIEDGLIYMRPQ